jgi:hypothetical protein
MPRTAAAQMRSSDAAIPASLTAASIAHPGLLKKRLRRPVSIESWQAEVWKFYDEVGEFRYSLNWIANVCSRAELFVELEDGKRDTGDLIGILDEITGGRERQAEFIRMAALHLTAVGEFWIVNRPLSEEEQIVTARAVVVEEEDGSTFVWEVVGVTEITMRDKTYVLTYDNMPEIELTEADVVVRVWRPHPKNRFRADSAGKAALPILRQIVGFDQHINTQLISRFTGNGVMFLPSEMTIKTEGTNASLTMADAVTIAIGDAMSEAIEDPTSAAAQVPVIITTPGEHIGKIKHVQFWSPLDEKADLGREKGLGRLATTMDLPKEVVTGTGDMNRWGAWQVEESSVKVHIEPTINIIRTALTLDIIRTAEPVKAARARVMADTTTLRLRPNRSKEAVELWDRGILNDEALVRETGFDVAADMRGDDREQWLLMQLVKASWNPQQAQAALKILGVDLGIPLPEDNAQREARPTPSLQEHPVQGPPEESISDGSIPVAASLAWRAMERAGNRLKTLTGKRELTCSSEHVHMNVEVFPGSIPDLLKGSFDCAETFGLDDLLVHRTKSYCERLLINHEPFNFQAAVQYLKGA